MLPERGRRTVPEVGLSFERIIGFQRRDPLLCESLVELENLWAARDPYRCHREVEYEALGVVVGVWNETGSRQRKEWQSLAFT